jgi:O-methyltransferase domain
MTVADTSNGERHLIAELRDLIVGGERAAMIHAVVRLGVPDLLADGALDTAQLAERSASVPDVLGRLLRALAASGLFSQTDDGKWALTPLGEWLRPDRPGGLHAFAIYANQPWMRAAWDHLEHSLRAGGVPFEQANGAPFFAYLDDHPEARRIFDSVMATHQAQRLAGLAAAYDWSRFHHIVDVGGGEGILLLHLLRACPSLRGTVFDLPHVVEVAKRHATWEGLADRFNGVGGSFFDDVPPGGDALILSRILHDWPDAACVRILRGCRAAMAPEAELLILERVIGDGAGQRSDKEADLHMHVVLGGKERTRGEFSALLAAAGLVLERVVETTTTNQIVVGRPG